jgi:hypothetical protein
MSTAERTSVVKVGALCARQDDGRLGFRFPRLAIGVIAPGGVLGCAVPEMVVPGWTGVTGVGRTGPVGVGVAGPGTGAG